MLCDICRIGLEGMLLPGRRLALKEDFIPRKEEAVLLERLKSLSAGTGPTDQAVTGEKQEAERYVYGHHIDKASFFRSVDEGCAMCNRFARGMDKNDEYYEDLGYYSVFSVFVREEQILMTAYFIGHQGGFAFVPVGDEKYDQNLNFNLEPSTKSPATWSTVDNWFRTCTESHEGCKETDSSNAYMPTRVIEIDYSQDVPSFRVVPGSSCPQGSRYVTLSHCWGDSTSTKRIELRESTSSDLATKQSSEILPKTYTEAFEIARRFGIHYLWIDRLCIRQDLGDDWRRESSVMQEVYKHAYFDISALGAKDDEVGCFFPRDPNKVAPTIVRIQLEPSSSPKQYRFMLEKGWAWRLLLGREPLIDRAWFVQERLLARRVLHFGQSQVYWECKEANCCETHPDGVRILDNVRGAGQQPMQANPHLWKQLLDAPDRRRTDDPYEQLFVDWNSVISMYASRKLSVSSDKLVAIAGLANDMKTKLQELRPGRHRYLAGLWEEKLLEHITWNVTNANQRSSVYRAPSWSWACLDGTLNILLHSPTDHHLYARLITVEVRTVGEDETGQVNSGFVKLSGPLTKADVDTTAERDVIMPNMFSITFLNNASEASLADVRDGINGPHTRVIFDTMTDIRDDIFVLLIGATPWAQGKWAVSGLALTVAESSNASTYQRVGCVSLYMDMANVSDFCAAWPYSEATII